LLASEANRLLSTAIPWNGIQVVVAALPDRDPQQVRRLASLLAEHTRTVALLGTGGERAYLVFARSNDLSMDMSSLLKDICQAQGGNGGGQSGIAQGGGFPGERVGEALQNALRFMTTGQGE
jgi:alanyl-tRNA synthetase